MDDLLTKLRQKIGAPDCEINKQREAAAEEIARLTAEVVKWKAEAGKYGAGCPACDDIGDENKRLTAERDALREALTPSGATKAAYIGEFRMDFNEIDEFGEDRTVCLDVPWTTVKEIMAAILKRADTNEQLTREVHHV